MRDSFTDGHGIKHVDNRYSDIIAEKMSEIRAVNLGMNGLDTRGAFETLIEFTEKT